MNLEFKLQSIMESIPSKNIYLASDFRKILYRLKENEAYHEDLLSDILESLVKNLGSDYTIVIPTFNWDFCHEKEFDYFKTKSQTGIFSQIALSSNVFKRTKHPIYSFAVYGMLSGKFLDLTNVKSFGKGSPFELLYEHDFYFLAIDVSFSNSFTYVHHVEQIFDVSYRFEKEFSSNYIDEHGIGEKKTYSMFVRDIKNGVNTSLNNFYEKINNKGLISHGSIGVFQHFYLRIIDVHYEIETEIKKNKGRSLYAKRI
jgi:aminoglycoside 3-N-acetyltransferase